MGSSPIKTGVQKPCVFASRIPGGSRENEGGMFILTPHWSSRRRLAAKMGQPDLRVCQRLRVLGPQGPITGPDLCPKENSPFSQADSGGGTI